MLKQGGLNGGSKLGRIFKATGTNEILLYILKWCLFKNWTAFTKIQIKTT